VRSAPDTLAVIGAGSIGSSWVALALAHGSTVHAADPDPGIDARLRATVSAHLAELDTGPEVLDRLTVHSDPAQAAAENRVITHKQ